MKGNTLRGKTPVSAGQKVESLVKLRNAKSGRVRGAINLNGVLSCQTGIIPPGSYLGT